MDIDLYCERIRAGEWAEPWNTLSNIAFFLAAALPFQSIRRSRKAESFFLVSLVFAIGVGSSLFHYYGTTQTLLFDVVPIAVFQLSFLAFYLLNVRKLSFPLVLLSLGVYLLLTIFLGRSEILPSGSSGYLPAFIMLAWLAVLHRKMALKESNILVIASATFFVSLVFRSLDMKVCAVIPMGTHAVWHILNALVLYLCLRAYLVNDSPEREQIESAG